MRHSGSKLPACDLHALGTPPAFVLSQDQTLRYMDWNVTEVTSAPNGMDRVRVHHHDSVVKVQCAVWPGQGRIKNQGSASGEAGGHLATSLATRLARFAWEKDAREPELLRLRFAAVRRRR